MKKILAVGLLALTPSLLLATPIVSMPSDSDGPFRHNVFHAAESAGGAAGQILAWFNLDTNASSFWDADTGALSLNISIYSDSDLTTAVGTASASSDNLMGANLNGFDGGLIGNISWSFDLAAQEYFSTRDASLDLSGIIMMSFMDFEYASNSSGDIANSYQSNLLTLWGADGLFNNGVFEDSSLGVDMMMEMSEPGILLLMGLGLIGLGATARRR
ncbi:MAG: hypothetical protein HKO55_07685 [Gammaproteobacteria bacterium]|nr:hypothetical protein [Gammaproteobacteria bacterium]NNM21134.1 hypothetical protein [Gammaproteobacteria bacterium]